MDIGSVVGFFIFVMWLWVNILVIRCLFLDPSLEPVQRWSQTAIVILFPVIGASFVLYLLNQHSPEVVNKFYIPWPFSYLISNKSSSKRASEYSNEVMPDSSQNSSSGGGGIE